MFRNGLLPNILLIVRPTLRVCNLAGKVANILSSLTDTTKQSIICVLTIILQLAFSIISRGHHAIRRKDHIGVCRTAVKSILPCFCLLVVIVSGYIVVYEITDISGCVTSPVGHISSSTRDSVAYVASGITSPVSDITGSTGNSIADISSSISSPIYRITSSISYRSGKCSPIGFLSFVKNRAIHFLGLFSISDVSIIERPTDMIIPVDLSVSKGISCVVTGKILSSIRRSSSKRIISISLRLGCLVCPILSIGIQ